MFKNGQKVECINHHWWKNPHTGDNQVGPRFKEICTVRGYDNSGLGGLLFEEYGENRYADGTEQGYVERLFRAVVEKKTDISIFTEMLIPVKTKEKVS